MKKILIRLLLIFLALLLVSAVVFAATEQDFTTYFEYDPYSHLTITSDAVTFTNVERKREAYVYKDFGADNFSADVNVTFDLHLNDIDNNHDFSPFILSNTANVTYYETIDDPKYSSLSVDYSKSSEGTENINIKEVSGGSVYGSSQVVITGQSPLYLMFSRDEDIGTFGTATLYLYSDEDRETLYGSTSLTLHEKQDFRYLYAFNVYTWGSSNYYADGSVENMSLLADFPEVATLETEGIYNTTFGYWEATFTGNVTDDGDASCDVGFLYREKDSEDEWEWAGVGPGYTTGEEFEITVTELTPDIEIEVKAYAENEAGISYGELVYFDTIPGVSVPVVETYAYPIVINTDNVTLYGNISYDGSSNCTAWFRYKQSDDEDWNISDNVTDLTTGDGFNILVTENLTQLVQYDYQALALNDTGTGNGSIAHFTIYPPLVIPVLTSDNVTNLTSGSAKLHGTLVNDGDEDGAVQAWVGFQYKAVGSSVWLHTPLVLRDSGDSFLYTVTGLMAETNYEWRAYGSCAVMPSQDPGTGYGEILGLYTYPTQIAPVVYTANATTLSDTSVRLRGRITFDGGYPCTVWFQYRKYGETAWLETSTASGAVTDDEFIQLVFELENKSWYEWRAAGSNDIGTSYGVTKQFYMISPAEQDETTPTSPSNPFEGLDDLLAPYGLNNLVGHMIIVTVLMAICFVGFYKSEVLRVVMPLLIFAIALVIGWFDIWVVVLLALAAGLTTFGLLRRKVAGKGAD